MKKAISLAVAAFVATMALGLSAFAAGDPTATLQSKDIFADTTTVSLELTVANLPATGVTTITIAIPEFPAGVVLTAFESATIANFGCMTAGNELDEEPYKMSWNSGNGDAVMLADGTVLATLTFSIAGPLEVGDVITISIESVEDGNVDGDELDPGPFDFEVVDGVLTVIKTPLEELKDILEDLLENGDLDEETAGRVQDILDALDDASEDAIEELLEIARGLDGSISEEDLSAMEEILANEEGGEEGGEGEGSTSTGETSMIAAAIATVAIAGATIVALKKRR